MILSCINYSPMCAYKFLNGEIGKGTWSLSAAWQKQKHQEVTALSYTVFVHVTKIVILGFSFTIIFVLPVTQFDGTCLVSSPWR